MEELGIVLRYPYAPEGLEASDVGQVLGGLTYAYDVGAIAAGALYVSTHSWGYGYSGDVAASPPGPPSRDGSERLYLPSARPRWSSRLQDPDQRMRVRRITYGSPWIVDLVGEIPGILIMIAGGTSSVVLTAKNIAKLLELPSEIKVRSANRAADIAAAGARAAQAKVDEARAVAELIRMETAGAEPSPEQIEATMQPGRVELAHSELRQAVRADDFMQRRIQSRVARHLGPDQDQAAIAVRRAHDAIEDRVTSVLGPAEAEIYDLREGRPERPLDSQ